MYYKLSMIEKILSNFVFFLENMNFTLAWQCCLPWAWIWYWTLMRLHSSPPRQNYRICHCMHSFVVYVLVTKIPNKWGKIHTYALFSKIVGSAILLPRQLMHLNPPQEFHMVYKEVCNGWVACSLLKLDGGWQATPSITKFLISKVLETLRPWIYLFLSNLSSEKYLDILQSGFLYHKSAI